MPSPADRPDDTALPRYDISRSYEWNYNHAPAAVEIEPPPFPGVWSLCGLAVDSPLGIPAGPLLNGAWIRYYASLGFDVLTYKTVRTSPQACYPLPNLQPVTTAPLPFSGRRVHATETFSGSWAVSFGMPSQPADTWRKDIEQTRRNLPTGKLLSVSVVGTTDGPSDGLEQLADDYALCAQWAAESGADLVEANFSCPNVCSTDGQLYEQAEAAGLVAERISERLNATPLAIKVGLLPDRAQAARLLHAIAPFVQAVSMTNCISAKIEGPTGETLFGDASRGIGGEAIRAASVEQVRTFRELIVEGGLDIELIGVGGAASTADVQEYLSAGATSVQMATAAMIDPLTAVRIRREWPNV